jgi:pimeloyl-ACP methyl ester carboxylesterase
MLQQVPDVLAELWKRRVVQFGALYLATAWVLLQVVLAVTDTLHLPDWVGQVALLFLALGFPLVLILAWARETVPPAPGEATAERAAKVAPSSQTTRYCTAADGVRIAYASLGKGPPIVKAANWITHLDYDCDYSDMWQIYAALARDHRLVRYDQRGSGLSDWDAEDISFEAFVRDLETVVEAAKLDKFLLFGISQGAPVSIAYAVRHPERVAAMILLGGYPAGSYPLQDAEHIKLADTATSMMRIGWGQDNPAFRQFFTSTFYPHADSETAARFNEMQRRSASPENAARIFQANNSLDVRRLLPRVSVPTLILHARGDQLVPFESGRALARGIPGARIVSLDSDCHLLMRGDPAWPRAEAEIRAFLDEHWPGTGRAA